MILTPAESAFLKAELNVDFFDSVSRVSPDVVAGAMRIHFPLNL